MERELNHYGLKVHRFESNWKLRLRLKPTESPFSKNLIPE